MKQRETVVQQEVHSSNKKQSSKTFKYSMIASVSALGALSSIVGFYAYHLLTKTAFMSPVLGICAAIGLAAGVMIFKFVEAIYKYKYYTNPEKNSGERASTAFKLTFYCGNNPQQITTK
jgi:H+/Cl- antiporter ClcA